MNRALSKRQVVERPKSTRKHGPIGTVAIAVLALAAACRSGADHADALTGVDPEAKSDALVYFMEEEGPTGLEDETRDLLRDTLRAERNPLVRAQAAQALGRALYDPEIRPPESPEAPPHTLSRGAEHVEWLLEKIEDPRQQYRYEPHYAVRFDVVIALTTLGRSCDATVLARIGKAFALRLGDGEEHPWVKIKAARGLGDLKIKEEAPALVAALADSDQGVRLNAYRALVAISGDNSLEPVQADWKKKYPSSPTGK